MPEALIVAVIFSVALAVVCWGIAIDVLIACGKAANTDSEEGDFPGPGY